MSEGETEPIAGQLIAELERGGQLVDEGDFTLDASKAFERLRDQQIADPREYILRLVEAAALAGADPIVLERSMGGLELELGPLVLRRDDLEQLYAALLRSDGDGSQRQRGRVLQQLALAVLAGLRLELRSIEIESVDAAGAGVLLEATPEQPLGQLEVIERGQPGSRVRVRRSLASVGASLEWLGELELVHQRCRLAGRRISIDERWVSSGWSSSLAAFAGEHEQVCKGCRFAIRDAEGRQIGVAGVRSSVAMSAKAGRSGAGVRLASSGAGARLASSGAGARLALHSNGVLLERLPLDSLGPRAHEGFIALLDLDLPKDLAHNRVRRGPELDELLQAVERAHDEVCTQHETCLASKAERVRRAREQRALQPSDNARALSELVEPTPGERTLQLVTWLGVLSFAGLMATINVWVGLACLALMGPMAWAGWQRARAKRAR